MRGNWLARRVRPREWAFREEHAVDRRVLRGFKRLPLTLSAEAAKTATALRNAQQADKDAAEALRKLRPACGVAPPCGAGARSVVTSCQRTAAHSDAPSCGF